jgi:acetyl esterase
MSDSSSELDTELATVIEEFEQRGVPPWHTMSVDYARQLEDELFSAGTGPELDLVRTIAIDGPGGELPVRIYRPSVADAPTLVFYHGGGWTLGTLDSADDICRELASRSGCLVASVDYRLAPEHPFPAAVDDARCALEWVRANAASFGADSEQIGVSGTSAGGNLAAATALWCQEDGIDLDGQFLLYPITNHGFGTDSYEEHADSSLLGRTGMRWFWDQYLRSPVDAANPYASLLEASDVSRVAPATVVTAGFDVLRDEGVAYAAKLDAAGVDTSHHHYPSMAHGFLSMTDDVAVADEAMDRLAESITQRLDSGTQPA